MTKTSRAFATKNTQIENPDKIRNQVIQATTLKLEQEKATTSQTEQHQNQNNEQNSKNNTQMPTLKSKL